MSSPPLSVAVDLPPELIAEIRTGPARRAWLNAFTPADPDDRLSEAERTERARAALSAHMSSLGKASGRAKRARKAAAVNG